jgi:hypothetical protein
MLEITTEPNRFGSRVSAHRRNGDKVYLGGEARRQLKTVRKILMKLAGHYGLKMIEHADFLGVERINATNDDLVECLSSAPDPYSGVDLRAAMVAWRRDLNITNQILHQDPSVDQLLAVCDNQEDWLVFWRCNCPVPAIRDHLAQELAKARALKAENQERLARRKAADGTEH